jgi:hypothetical protein
LVGRVFLPTQNRKVKPTDHGMTHFVSEDDIKSLCNTAAALKRVG